jgi:RNA polymerase sigma-70 factor, ECF subfamily
MLEKLTTSSEDVLVDRSIRGDQRAFGLLVERYKHMIYTTAVRLLRDTHQAEDAAQETFIKAWTALPGFEGRSKFSSWLYRVCYNTCISILRRRRDDVELEPDTATAPDCPADDFRNKDIQAVLEQEVAALPADYRTAVTLYHFDGLSYEEIARMTRRPMGTVKATLHRARALLRTRLVERVGWDSLMEVMWR